MRLLLDADGLIKLHRARVLQQVVRAFSCAVPSAVYDEVVTKGKTRLYRDAEMIEEVLTGAAEVLPVRPPQQPQSGLGAGELSILTLLSEERDAIAVSDDRRFLAVLSAQGFLFLTPADMLILMVRRGILTRDAAREALDRLRPAIRLAAYWDARQDLEAIEENHGEE